MEALRLEPALRDSRMGVMVVVVVAGWSVARPVPARLQRHRPGAIPIRSTGRREPAPHRPHHYPVSLVVAWKWQAVGGLLILGGLAYLAYNVSQITTTANGNFRLSLLPRRQITTFGSKNCGIWQY